ncbi:MAG: dephospho-CoA kinase [candidate division KSB1 bacterium]|nr:dephospho-CoA kinase [candidate division KSB1 bacterium]
MLKVAITGSIGSGKTEVCRILERMGWPVLDADSIARDLVDEDREIRERLLERFGPAYFDDEGRLKRRELGQLVFADPAALHDLNAIVHPALRQAIGEKLEQLEAQRHKWAFVEAAVLFEAKMENLFDVVAVVVSDLTLAVQRTAQRLRIPEEEAWNRYRSQIPVEEKIRRADYVIRNDGSLRDLEQAVQDFLAWLKSRGR